ncbi:MAG: hypothetical protein J5755_00995 [Clostridia bacterium]|nr:hypothetical protein [Clostridia bacterium]
MKKKRNTQEEQEDETLQQEVRYEDTLDPKERKAYLKAIKRQKMEEFVGRNWLVIILALAVVIMMSVLMLLFAVL